MPAVTATTRASKLVQPVTLAGSGTATSSFSGTHSVQSRGGASSAYRCWNWQVSYQATDPASPYTVVAAQRSGFSFGSSVNAAVGSAIAVDAGATIDNNGDSDNEHAAYFGVLNYRMGTGYSVTAPSGGGGRAWLMDIGVHGPIAVQSSLLNGITCHMNNYYNGSPADGASAGLWVSTKPGTGPGVDANHQAATTYPMDVGVGVVGVSGAPGVEDGVGFTTGVRVGGTGTGWEAQSRFVTGVEVRDYTDTGIAIPAAKAGASGYKALTVGANAGPVIIGATTPIYNTTVLEIIVNGEADPAVSFGSEQSVSYAVYVKNSVGEQHLFVCAGTDDFITGTVAGDTGIRLSGLLGDKWHIGGTAAVMTVGKNDTLGFFQKSPVGQQTGGAATAGGTYGSGEQTMLQKAYDALRAFGLLS